VVGCIGEILVRSETCDICFSSFGFNSINGDWTRAQERVTVSRGCGFDAVQRGAHHDTGSCTHGSERACVSTRSRRGVGFESEQGRLGVVLGWPVCELGV
jgi:hypothetical protein